MQKNKNGYSLQKESICAVCVFRSCGECPSRLASAYEKIEDFPQIIKGTVINGRIYVEECRNFMMRGKTQEVPKAEYDWNSKIKHNLPIILQKKQ